MYVCVYLRNCVVLEGPADHRGALLHILAIAKEINHSRASPQCHIFTELHWADGEGGDKVTLAISSLFQIQSLMFGHYIFYCFLCCFS